MRRKMLCVFMALWLLALLIPAAAAEDPSSGTVLFAQRYTDLTDLRMSGIRVGTTGGTPRLGLDEALHIDVSDDWKSYILLPDLPDGGGWCDTYTVEFSFRFTDVTASNGYFGFLMTGQGDGPSNRTEMILRVSGVCDGVGQLDEAIANAMSAGETVHVSIFVEHGMMYALSVRAGENVQTLTLPAVKTIGVGRRGFVLRNASVALDSVEVISGVGYGQKQGSFADSSYWVESEDLFAPDTSDASVAVWLMGASVACAAFLWRRRRV